MTEVVFAIVSKVSEFLVDPAIHQGYYLFCVGKLTKKLDEEKENLTSTIDGISQRAGEAKKKTEKIENAVKKWLQEAQSLLQDAENLEKEVRASGCFWNLCPTWRRYCLCKQLARKIERMMELKNNSKFERFSSPISLPTNVEYFSSGNFMIFKSTKLAYDQLLEAMKDDDCFMVCLHGMGGCGKTTLAIEVSKRAKELNLFDKVVFTTVSKSPNVRKIQGEIADELGLSPLKEESEAGRARRLSLGMRKGRILIVLDDVWGILNLEDFGIPLNCNLEGCKVLLTTRLQQLCSLMNGQRNVPLHLLSEEEAWTFFQNKACIVDDSSLLNTVAREVAAECKGLPIAIQAVGTALKGKPLDNWKDALYKLRHSKPIGVPQGVKDAFTCLQYSYDALTSNEAKGLFLTCSIFQEDRVIKREDLFRYGVGLGLFGEASTFDDLRSRVNAALTDLLDYSLIMHSETGQNCFKIHDVVHDFALWVASTINRPVIVDHAKGLSSLALEGNIKNCFAISTWSNKDEDPFPQQLYVQKLEMLLLISARQFNLSHASFEGIEGLKVMALCATYHFQKVSVSLPQSTQWLSNLRTLRLVRCNLGDISFVVSLKSLEILDLKRSEFRLLPKGIEELTKLKLLDLRHCSIMENCDEVIKRCSQLEELYVYGDEAYFGKNISDSHNTWFLENASFLKLQRYRLQFGKAKIPLKSLPLISRALLIRELKIPTLSIVVKDMMQRADCLFLEDLVGGCKSIIPDLVAAVGSMKQVIKLSLYSCLEIEFFIICSTNPSQACHDFPMLMAMKLSAMKHLKQVCLGPPPPKFFQNLKEVFMCDCPQLTRIFPGECNLCNLKELVISKCPMLTSLFSKQVAQTLLQLEVMKIEYCSELECIIFDEEDDIGATTREQKVHVLENSPLTFPKLRILTVEECDKLGYIFPIFFAQGLLELQKIKITSAPQMKYVFGKDVAEDLSTNQKKIQILFPQLKEIHLSFLPSLVKICQENCHPCWPSLKEINWLSCPNLTNKGPHEIETMGCEVLCISNCGVTDIFHVRGDGHRSNDQEATTSKLKEVKLEILQELSIIWRGLHSFTQILNLSYLESITIDRCGKLKCIFPAFIDRGFPHLIDLAIHSCENLEEIFEENEEELQNPSRVQECFPKLEEITVTGCPKLKVIFSIRMVKSFPQLKTLWISESLELKEIFGGPNEGIISDNEKEISVPNLRVITLENLPNLTDICQGFNFLPKELHKIQIYGCTKFAPILEATRFWREKGLRIFVCNRGVIDIFQIDGSVNFGGTEQYQYMGGQVVLLESEHKLWSGPIPRNVLSFQYLRSLVVSQCSTMKCLFPLSVIHEGLPELAYLLISGCDEMEQLVDIEEDIGEQEVNACINNIQVSGCFPKLRELMVDSCNKLIRLLPAKILIARELPQLEIMLIVNAAELRELFGQKVALPNMKKLTLANVPHLTSSSVETISRKGGGMYSIAQIGSRLVHLFE